MTTPPIPLTAPDDDYADATPQASAPPAAAATPDALEAAAAAERETAYLEDANRTWNGAPLKAWSEDRQRLLDALCLIDVPMPDLQSSDPLTFIAAYFPRAVKALFLASHEPHQWEALRPRLLSVIDAWGVENVPAESMEDREAAVSLVLRMERAHRTLMAQRRPRRFSGDQSGN